MLLVCFFILVICAAVLAMCVEILFRDAREAHKRWMLYGKMYAFARMKLELLYAQDALDSLDDAERLLISMYWEPPLRVRLLARWDRWTRRHEPVIPANTEERFPGNV